jgi:hypothetical protein
MRMMSTTLLVDELLKLQMLIDHTCMLRIACKPMLLITFELG